jgi:hypothetical protein
MLFLKLPFTWRRWRVDRFTGTRVDEQGERKQYTLAIGVPWFAVILSRHALHAKFVHRRLDIRSPRTYDLRP